MKRWKSYGLLFLTILLSMVFVVPASAADSESNLVKNSTFSNKMAKWTTYSWVNESSEFSENDGVLTLESEELNHVVLQQKITVAPKTIYRISGQVRMSDIVAEGQATGGMGLDYTYAMIYGDPAKTEWQDIDFYVRTQKRQKQVTLNLSLGDYGNLSRGKIEFQNIAFEKVDAAPNGVDVLEAESYNDGGGDGVLPADVTYGVLWRNVIFAVLGAAILYAVYRWSLQSGWSLSNATTDNIAAAVLVVGFILRLVLTITSAGYPNDTQAFASWSARVTEVGPGQFYEEGYFADYPPGMMYLLWFSGLFNRLLGITDGASGAGLIVLMLPTLICDLAVIIVAYRYAVKRWDNNIGLGICIILAFFPATLFDGAMWHQVDSILTLTLVLVFILLDKKKFIGAGALYGLAVLLKPQALMVGPAFAMCYILYIIDAFQEQKEKQNRAGMTAIIKTILAAAAAIVVILIGSWPFKGNQEAFWLVDKYYTTGTSYPYASVNAYNLFSLMGHNFQPETDLIPLLSISYKTLGNIFILIIIGITVVFALKARKKKTFDIYLLSAFLLMGIFCFGPRMHERYAYPALIFLVFAWLKLRDKGIMNAFIFLGASQLANMSVALYSLNYPLPNSYMTLTVQTIIAIANILGFVYLAIVCYDVFVKGKINTDITGNVYQEMLTISAGETTLSKTLKATDDSTLELSKESVEEQMTEVIMDTKKKDKNFNSFFRAKQSLDAPSLNRHWWTRKDTWFMLGITAIYAVIAFINLGTTQVPETYWRGTTNASVVMDFGEIKTISQIWVYGGICDGAVEFAPAEAADTSVSEVSINYDVMYRWSVTSLNNTFTTDKLIMKVTSGNVWINELAFIDAEGNVVTPMIETVDEQITDASDILIQEKYDEIAADQKSSVRHLFDENNLVPANPSSNNGMYFDELYHGRTAYEHLNGMTVYEFTHPPLGKILISLGIAVFGMNPFGWRCVGTLIGVLMLPVFYALAKRMFKRSEFALFATTLFAFDFMHFVQTRISTIDVYSVFFVLLMYYFMFEYWQMNFYTDGLKKTLRPLGLCGLFFGLGAASKWTCIYAGVGLAVLLFMSLYRRVNEYYLARSALKQSVPDTPEYEQAQHYVKKTERLPRNILYTILFCVGVFVIVPGIIYFFSYIPFPFFKFDDMGSTVSSFVDMQKSMFRYHSTLEARHPFESTWMSWLVDGRPIWYYAGANEFLPGTQVASIAAFGNPVVWWAGLIGVVLLIYYSIQKKFTDKIAIFILVGFASQLMPWMLVTRASFIYHYFGSVPFIILALTYVLLQLWNEEKYRSKVKGIMIFLVIATIVLFVFFYPILSGMPVPDWYAKLLEWFPSWRFYSHR